MLRLFVSGGVAWQVPKHTSPCQAVSGEQPTLRTPGSGRWSRLVLRSLKPKDLETCRGTLMAYAPQQRAFYDADSHIMELPDFLQKYADPELRAEMPVVSYAASLVTDEEVPEIMARGGHHTPEHIAEQLAMGDRLIESSKEIQALGAFEGGERTLALDLLGFKKQLV